LKVASEGVRSSTPALKCEWYLGASAAKVLIDEKTVSTGPVRIVSASR
jgi:hypothetical protein